MTLDVLKMRVKAAKLKLDAASAYSMEFVIRLKEAETLKSSFAREDSLANSCGFSQADVQKKIEEYGAECVDIENNSLNFKMVTRVLQLCSLLSLT